MSSPIADTVHFKIMVEEIDKDNDFEEAGDLHYLGLLKLLALELPYELNPKSFMDVYSNSFNMVRDIEGMNESECAKLHFRAILLIGDVFPWEFSTKIAESLKTFLS